MTAGPTHHTQRPGPWTLAIIACVLVLAQALLAGHQVGHLAHGDETAACEICLIGGGLGAPLAAGSCGPAALVLAPGQVLAPGLPPDPVAHHFRPQAPRAPPV
jgi:hypothetical protein